MKHSMFLFLLNFTSSLSTYFEITQEPGIYIWNIPENENEKPTYVDLNDSSRLKYDISKSTYPYWDVPGSSSAVQSTSILKTENTYIILNINPSHDFFLFYWVGAQSSEEKRKNVAHSVAFILREKILKKIPEVKLKTFHREAEGAESGFFTPLLDLPTPMKKPRLYRVEGSKGQFITEVPLIYSEINGSDSFLFDKSHWLLIWNSFHSNIHKQFRVNELAQNISAVSKRLKCTGRRVSQVTEGQHAVELHKYNSFKGEFLKDIKGVPEPWQFPRTPANYSDLELANKRRENLKLYAYFWSYREVVEHPVEWEILTIDIFRENAAYVLVDHKCGNIIALLGRYADIEQTKRCLSAAEKFSKTIGVEDAWQRVKIFRLGKKPPVWLKIFFEYHEK